MRNLAGSVERWQRSGTDAMVARVVGGQGLGAWVTGEALAVTATGETAGTILGGTVSGPVIGAARTAMSEGRADVRLSVHVGQDDALVAGLACGGEARVAIQSVASLPGVLWSDLADNQAVALVVRVDDGPAGAGESLVVRSDGTTAGALGDPALDGTAREVAGEMLRKPRPDLRVVRLCGAAVAVEVFGTFPQVVVVGGGDLAAALDLQCGALGWPYAQIDDASDAIAKLTELGRTAALVMLSHDPEVDGPVLAAAVASGVGYVGALGSRRTQRQHAERLEHLGVGEVDRSSIFGPIGLDLGARNPRETALAICAEILGTATGGVSGSFRDTDHPIHR